MNRGGRKRENPGHLNDNSEIKSGFCFALSSNSRELLTRECSELFCQRRCIRNESVNLSLELVEQKKKLVSFCRRNAVFIAFSDLGLNPILSMTDKV